MLKRIGIAVAALVLLAVAVIATRPATFKVERSAVIAAPPDIVFALINDFHRWADWTHWAKLDPNQKTTFAGPPSGLGAITTWSGNDQVGEGRMTIVGVKPNEEVDIRLEFIKPSAATSQSLFQLKPGSDGATQVTWIMNGTNDFIGKAFCMFVDLDKMIGPDFERGLAQLKTVAEAELAKKRTAEEAAKVEAAAAPSAPAPTAPGPAPTK